MSHDSLRKRKWCDIRIWWREGIPIRWWCWPISTESIVRNEQKSVRVGQASTFIYEDRGEKIETTTTWPSNNPLIEVGYNVITNISHWWNRMTMWRMRKMTIHVTTWSMISVRVIHISPSLLKKEIWKGNDLYLQLIRACNRALFWKKVKRRR